MSRISEMLLSKDIDDFSLAIALLRGKGYPSYQIESILKEVFKGTGYYIHYGVLVEYRRYEFKVGDGVLNYDSGRYFVVQSTSPLRFRETLDRWSCNRTSYALNFKEYGWDEEDVSLKRYRGCLLRD